MEAMSPDRPDNPTPPAPKTLMEVFAPLLDAEEAARGTGPFRRAGDGLRAVRGPQAAGDRQPGPGQELDVLASRHFEHHTGARVVVTDLIIDAGLSVRHLVPEARVLVVFREAGGAALYGMRIDEFLGARGGDGVPRFTPTTPIYRAITKGQPHGEQGL